MGHSKEFFAFGPREKWARTKRLKLLPPFSSLFSLRAARIAFSLFFTRSECEKLLRATRFRSARAGTLSTQANQDPNMLLDDEGHYENNLSWQRILLPGGSNRDLKFDVLILTESNGHVKIVN